MQCALGCNIDLHRAIKPSVMSLHINELKVHGEQRGAETPTLKSYFCKNSLIYEYKNYTDDFSKVHSPTWKLNLEKCHFDRRAPLKGHYCIFAKNRVVDVQKGRKKKNSCVYNNNITATRWQL